MSQYHPQLSILWHDSRLGYDSRTGGHCLEDALKGTIDNLGVEVVTRYQRTLFEGTRAKMLERCNLREVLID